MNVDILKANISLLQVEVANFKIDLDKQLKALTARQSEQSTHQTELLTQLDEFKKSVGSEFLRLESRYAAESHGIDASVIRRLVPFSAPPVPIKIIRTDDYRITRTIGRGSVWSTDCGCEIATGNAVAIRHFENTEVGVKWFARYVAIPAQLNLPGIVRVIGYNYKDRVIVEEFMPHEGLDSLIKLRLTGRLPKDCGPTQFSKIIFGVAATMAQVHARHIVHRDLKPEYLMLDSNYEPHISGFGGARFESETGDMTNFMGTPMFMPPEQISSLSRYDRRVDIYAYAIFLCMLFTNNMKLDSAQAPQNPTDLHKSIISGYRFVRPSGIPGPLWLLITQCWSTEPGDRPSFGEITQRMLESDDYVLSGTDLDEYHEYQNRITLQSAFVPVVDNGPILKLVRESGIDVDSISGLTP
jgi:serine/threonine protein kinase